MVSEVSWYNAARTGIVKRGYAIATSGLFCMEAIRESFSGTADSVFCSGLLRPLGPPLKLKALVEIVRLVKRSFDLNLSVIFRSRPMPKLTIEISAPMPIITPISVSIVLRRVRQRFWRAMVMRSEMVIGNKL
ncbi:hypothetical protein D3C86_1268430 [compost metagenome]